MPKKDEPDILRLRFRRTTALAGTVHAANTHTAVEATDEAWAAVNRGDADLDPPPGVDGQPFPPEELTTAPAPTPPAFAAPAAAPARATAPATGTPAPAPADYEAMTAEELHHEATTRNLDGRSGLDKAGLVKALTADDKKRARK
jgi:hypothetical protein